MKKHNHPFIAFIEMLSNVKPVKKEDVMKSLVKNVELQVSIRKQHTELNEKAEFFENTKQMDKMEKLAEQDNELHDKFGQTIGETSMLIDMAASMNRKFKYN